MTVEELIQERIKLEKDIMSLIKDFQVKSGLLVSRIDTIEQGNYDKNNEYQLKEIAVRISVKV
ncbi:hypothetical protein [Adhaeribacter aquaticus]|uniref:hypothetical protein n=1 Tax=Adhaeribacter aquaticus TaxID=299567 RepID=UPI0003FA3BC3|nr:hypothetical protein [Adhaeribacter aquaticus]